MKFVIITGLSGAGKTRALRYMEDMDFYCIDNIPPALILKFAELCQSSNGKLNKIALVCDIRGGEMFSELSSCLTTMRENNYPYEILFLDAKDNVLIRRYKETRRKHPLVAFGRLSDAISEERRMLDDVKGISDHIIDTSDFKKNELSMKIREIYGNSEGKSAMLVNIMSFGFKYGIPLDADLVFDVRFLPNPFYIAELKHHTGLEECVSSYVMSFEQSKVFYEKLREMVEYLIPYYIEEGKSQLVIAIGCTGGQHRSVTIAQKLFEDIGNFENVTTSISHRDS